jgi:hypothetical protein
MKPLCDHQGADAVRTRRTVALGLAWSLSVFVAGPADAQRARVLSVEPADDDDLVSKDLEAKVEVKLTLKTAEIDRAIDAFGLDPAKATRRSIWFYDTADLSLFDRGLILRSRRGSKRQSDTTIKIRPLGGGRVDSEWLEQPGFKCEEDRVGERAISSCSYSISRDPQEIDAAGEGEVGVKKLFTNDQERFAEQYSKAVPWRSLVPLGPIATQAWKVRIEASDEPLVFEHWQIGDGMQTLEISTRTGADEAARAVQSLTQLLHESDLGTDSQQETKTRAALSQLAGQKR